MPHNLAGQGPALTSSTEPAGSRETESQTGLSRARVAREFARLFRERDMAAHPAEVRRLAGRFIARGHARLDDVLPYVLAYADPTGEAAARNVDRGRGVA